MKKTKLLTPIIGLSAITAIAPVVTLTSCKKDGEETFSSIDQNHFSQHATEYYTAYAEKIAAGNMPYTKAAPTTTSFISYIGPESTVDVNIETIDFGYLSGKAKAVFNLATYGYNLYLNVAGFTGSDLISLKDSVLSEIVFEKSISASDIKFNYYAGSQGTICMEIKAPESTTDATEKTYFEMTIGSDAHIHYLKNELKYVTWSFGNRDIPHCEIHFQYSK